MTMSAEVHLLSGSWFAIYIVQYNCNWLYLINLKIFICARAWGRGLCIIRTMNLDCNVHVNYLANCFTSHTEPTHETSMVTYLGAQTILFAYKERSNKLLRIPSSCSPCNSHDSRQRKLSVMVDPIRFTLNRCIHCKMLIYFYLFKTESWVLIRYFFASI